jgi:outer membrane protein assembly factor BamD
MALIVVLTALAAAGCGGGVPRIPDTPEAVLAKADQYYEQSKFFQAQELYKAFLSRYPGHDRGDYAQFMLGESFFNNREWPVAAVEYQILMNNYGYSEYVDDGLFKLGLCYYHEAPKSQRDQQKSEDALSRFNQFLQTFPNSSLVPQVNEYVKLIHEKLAEKTFDTGYYYFRRKKWTAALIYFSKVVDEYPGNRYWAQSAYFKAQILEDRGENDEAVRFYSMVLTYPDDLNFKPDVRRRLDRMRD